ncbi:MAG: tetratricopeptide repeat protein [Clostridia bacterium]|nr:tetratricopeptide repeat protein [Clostridia bacterium]
MKEHGPVKPEDYEEPACLLCMDDDKTVRRIDVGRFISKLDSYYSKNDYDGAGRHLEYWYGEAVSGNDLRGRFSVLNEMLGHYRKTGNKEKALSKVNEILDVIHALGTENSISSATAYLNIGTVYKAFSMASEALPFFLKALDVYNGNLKEGDVRFGGLYNNMALALVDLHRYDEAFDFFNKAVLVMLDSGSGKPETAVTYLNMASAAEAKLGLEEAEELITEYLDLAESYLDAPDNARDGNYAFVCDKCAPVFSYYGRFYYANELRKRMKEIYERS